MSKHTAIKTVLYTAGILLLLNVGLLFFVSNFNAGFIFLTVVAVALILYGCFFERLTKGVHVAIIAVSALPLGLMLFLALYGATPTAQYDEDVAIVLGAGIRGEQVTRLLAHRLDTAIEYHRKNPDAIIIVCGGQGPGEDIPEALAMERYLIAQGIPQDIIIKEDLSTSTYENLTFAQAILDEHFEGDYSSVVITSVFHLYRASALAREMGLDSARLGAPIDWYTVPVNYVREVAAVAKAWATSVL